MELTVPTFTVIPTTLEKLRPYRDLYRHEMNCQIIHDSIHARPGWSNECLLHADGVVAGYGSVAVGGPWKEKSAAYEFFVLPPHRSRVFDLFETFLDATKPAMIETQSNDGCLGVLIHLYAKNVETESILYEDRLTTHLSLPGALVRRTTPDDAARVAEQKLDEDAEWLVEWDGRIVATGGILYHYNRPFGDVYMHVAEAFRRRGVGGFFVQELKRLCYEGGSAPGARCNPDNVASRKTLQKAGFVPCGHILHGDLAVKG